MTSLYPYQTTKIRAIFVYGSDFSRQQIFYDLGNEWLQHYWIITVFVYAVAIILYILRRRANIDTNFSINFLDAHSIFYGGGNIRALHKLERICFAIAMIGSFFLTSIMLASYSMHTITGQRFEKIDSFSKLNRRDVPFLISLVLEEFKEDIAKIFGYCYKFKIDFIFFTLKVFHSRDKFKKNMDSKIITSDKYQKIGKNSFVMIVTEHEVQFIATLLIHWFKNDIDIIPESVGKYTNK